MGFGVASGEGVGGSCALGEAEDGVEEASGVPPLRRIHFDGVELYYIIGRKP